MALNSIEKLRIWCQKVLPLVYDDSLSYYEVLTKVVNKLNEVIALAQEQNETIEEALSDIDTFETDMTSQFESYKTTLNAALDAFEAKITAQQSGFEGQMTQEFADFLADYEREFGITNLYGDSTTLAISQNQVSKLLDYTTNNNRFNPEVITSGKAIDNTGAVVDSANTAVTGYIEVQPGENIVAQAKNNTTSERYQGAGTGTDVPLVFDSIAGYDEDLTFVTGSYKSLVFNYQVPLGVKYIKLAMGQTILDGTNTDMSELAIVNSDGTIYPYQPYSEQNATVKMNALPVDDTTVGNHLWTANKINAFQAAVEGEIAEVASDVQSLSGSVATQGQAITNLTGIVTSLDGRVDTLETDMAAAKSDISAAKSDISDLEASDAQQSTDISDLKESIMGFYENLTPTFEQGTLNSQYGTFTNNLNRIATRIYYEVQANIVFNVSSEFDYSLFFYKNPVEQSINNYISTTSWLNGNNILGDTILIPNDAKLYRLAVKYHSGNTVPIEPENFTNTDYEIKVKANDAANSDFLSFCPAITFLCRDGMALDQIPPNSKYAIKSTAENQYDMIRFSVNKTTDNYYVCVHDAIINNLAVNTDGTAISGNVYVDQSTLAELNGYDWGLKYGAEYKGLKVPQLETCIKYATMYNISVALDIKFSSTVTDEDVEAISALLAKYAQLDAIFFAIPITTMQKFYAKSKKFSYLFAGTEEQATSQAGSLKLLHSAYNKIYLAYRPMGTAPTDSFITLAMNNDFNIMYSPIEGISELTELGFNKGVSLMECHYIPKIKKTVREYVNGLI